MVKSIKKIRSAIKGMATFYTEVEGIKLGKKPIDFLLINVPPNCNYRCKKCFTRANSRKIKNTLTLEDIFKLIKEGKKLGAKSVSILGEGEPLIYKNIKQVISYINKLGMIPIIATNGRLLTKEMINFLDKHNTTIGFSLDTLDEKKYFEYCGGNASLPKVLKNIDYARKLYVKRIYEKNNYRVYQLLLHMTVTPKNFKNMSQLKKFCKNDIFFDSQPLAEIGDAQKNISFFGKKLTYERYQKEGHHLIPPMVLTKTEKGKDICCLFYYGLAVGYNGEIMFDTHAIGLDGNIGNIRNYPLVKLLEKIKRLKELYLTKYKTGYCPVRSPTYKRFIKDIKINNDQKRN